jgi:hypothetical protein
VQRFQGNTTIFKDSSQAKVDLWTTVYALDNFTNFISLVSERALYRGLRATMPAVRPRWMW